MKAKRKTGYGLHELTRQIARRRQDTIERLEHNPRPPMRLTPEAELAADLFLYARQFKRPLAA